MGSEIKKVGCPFKLSLSRADNAKSKRELNNQMSDTNHELKGIRINKWGRSYPSYWQNSQYSGLPPATD